MLTGLITSWFGLSPSVTSWPAKASNDASGARPRLDPLREIVRLPGTAIDAELLSRLL
jgi:hypothetical protein